MSQDGEQHISLRTYVYNEELPLPIVIRKPIKPRPIDSDESGEELEDIYPAPICISCSGVDNDPLVWCSGCADPYHTDVSSIQTQLEMYQNQKFSVHLVIQNQKLEKSIDGFVNSVVKHVFHAPIRYQLKLKHSNANRVGVLFIENVLTPR